MDMYNTLLMIMNASANIKQLTSVKNIIDIMGQIRDLEKLCSELKFNDLLIEKATYMICDSKNVKQIIGLLSRKYNISLTAIDPEWDQDEIARGKIKVKTQLKKYLHSFTTSKDLIVDIVENLKDHGLSNDAKAINILMSQSEKEKNEFYKHMRLVQKLKDMKILFALSKFQKEEKPFSVTQMSKIYKATSSLFPNKELAMKEMDIGTSNFNAILKEVEINRNLKHENILPTLGCILQETQRKLFIIMEYVRGSTLDEKMKEGKLTKVQKLKIATGVASAIEHLHGRVNAITHGDIKGSNVIIKEGSLTPVIIDFGLSNYISRTSTDTQFVNGKVFGTLDFMSPELLLGKLKSPNTMSDIWSLGCLLAQLFSEAPILEQPWTINESEEDRITAIRMHMEDEEPPSIVNMVDLSIKYVITKCLSYDPQERITSSKLCNKLENLLELQEANCHEQPESRCLMVNESDATSHESFVITDSTPISTAAHPTSHRSSAHSVHSINHLEIEEKIPTNHIIWKTRMFKRVSRFIFGAIFLLLIFITTLFAIKITDNVSARSSSVFEDNEDQYGPHLVFDTVAWSKTKLEKYPWIELELTTPRTISDIILDARTHNKTYFEVRVGNESINNNERQGKIEINQHCDDTPPAEERIEARLRNFRMVCHTRITGNFVTIQLIGEEENDSANYLQVKYINLHYYSQDNETHILYDPSQKTVRYTIIVLLAIVDIFTAILAIADILRFVYKKTGCKFHSGKEIDGVEDNDNNVDQEGVGLKKYVSIRV